MNEDHRTDESRSSGEEDATNVNDAKNSENVEVTKDVVDSENVEVAKDGEGAEVVTDSPPSKPPMLVLLESLAFYRNVQIGVIVGVGLAVLLYLVRTLELLGPVTEVREYPLFGSDVWFLILAGVLAATVALLVATALTIGVAIRTGRQLDRIPNE